MTDMAEEEKKRIEEQKAMLGENGLAKKGDELESAIEQNEVIMSFPLTLE